MYVKSKCKQNKILKNWPNIKKSFFFLFVHFARLKGVSVCYYWILLLFMYSIHIYQFLFSATHKQTPFIKTGEK